MTQKNLFGTWFEIHMTHFYFFWKNHTHMYISSYVGELYNMSIFLASQLKFYNMPGDGKRYFCINTSLTCVMNSWYHFHDQKKIVRGRGSKYIWHISHFFWKKPYTQKTIHTYMLVDLVQCSPYDRPSYGRKKLKLKNRKHRKFWHGKIKQLNVKNMIHDCWFSWFHMFWWYL